MKSLGRVIRSFLKRDDGPTAVEYALMAVLIIGVLITVIALLGQDTGKTFTSDAEKINESRQ